MVKRLRHRPLTAVTRVRFPVGSPKSAARSCGAFLVCLGGGQPLVCHAHHRIGGGRVRDGPDAAFPQSAPQGHPAEVRRGAGFSPRSAKLYLQ